MAESITASTVYFTFRGYCMHCGDPVGSTVHGDDECEMEGAEARLALLGMAWEEWLRAERVERVLDAAREYLEWRDDENRQALLDALRFCEERDREIAEEKAAERGQRAGDG